MYVCMQNLVDGFLLLLCLEQNPVDGFCSRSLILEAKPTVLLQPDSGATSKDLAKVLAQKEQHVEYLKQKMKALRRKEPRLDWQHKKVIADDPGGGLNHKEGEWTIGSGKGKGPLSQSPCLSIDFPYS